MDKQGRALPDFGADGRARRDGIDIRRIPSCDWARWRGLGL